MLYAHAPDLSPEPFEFSAEIGVSPVDMREVEHFRTPFRAERGNDKRRSSAEVARNDARPVQPLHAAHKGMPPLHFDIRAHFLQFRHVFEARLEQVFHNERTALGARIQRRRLRLKIGRGSLSLFYHFLYVFCNRFRAIYAEGGEDSLL